MDCTMLPSASHALELNAVMTFDSTMVTAPPPPAPALGTFRRSPVCVLKRIHLPSRENDGETPCSVPGMGVASAASRALRMSIRPLALESE